MEAQIRGKETLGEPVPAVTQLVHLVGADGVHVRERHQLYACRCDRVEAGELPSGGRQGQRERLGAVAKEIAAGQNIVLVEIVVDLSDHAAEVVVRRGDQRGVGTVWASAIVSFPRRVEIAVRWGSWPRSDVGLRPKLQHGGGHRRSEEHTSELQSRQYIV